MRTEYKYGVSIRHVATLKNSMRLVLNGGYTKIPFLHIGLVMGICQDIYVSGPVSRSFHQWKQYVYFYDCVPCQVFVIIEFNNISPRSWHGYHLHFFL